MMPAQKLSKQHFQEPTAPQQAPHVFSTRRFVSCIPGIHMLASQRVRQNQDLNGRRPDQAAAARDYAKPLSQVQGGLPEMLRLRLKPS